MESWKEIDGYDGMYEVSNEGRVRSWCVRGRTGIKANDPRVLASGNTRGYRTVVLCRSGGDHRPQLVHQLVARAFLGPAPDCFRPTVNHKNLNKADNRVENLEWMAHADNNRHAAPHLPRNRGEANHSKLTERQVLEIRARWAARDTLASLGREFGVSPQTVQAIIQRRKWAHVE